MGFDAWYKSGSIWYPNSDSGNFWWDTANGGSDAVSVYPTSPEESHVKSGKAAKLESKEVAMVGLAAGNIYQMPTAVNREIFFDNGAGGCCTVLR